MTTDETLYTGEIANIATLIESAGFPLKAFVLVERMPLEVIDVRQGRSALLRFARLQDLKPGDIAIYTSGRIFNSDFELRWEQDAMTPGKASVVYIGTERNLPGLTKREEYTLQPENEGKDHGRGYYLFGERLDEIKQGQMNIKPENGYEYYAETRVPRLLLYPEVEKKDGKLPDRLQLIVRQYRLIPINPQQKGEESHTYRFVKLVAPEEEEARQV